MSPSSSASEPSEATILTLPGRTTETPGRHRPGNELSGAAAQRWEAWAAAAGEQLLPLLQALEDSLPGLESAMVCTADGFNLCSLGFDAGTVRRVSAMSSSLTSLASAVTATSRPVLADEGDTSLALLTLVHGASITVVLPVRRDHDDLLLWVTAGDTTLGALLVHAEKATDAIRAALA